MSKRFTMSREIASLYQTVQISICLIAQFKQNETYSLVKCIRRVEWGGDHFDLGLALIDPFLTKIYAKNDFYIILDFIFVHS